MPNMLDAQNAVAAPAAIRREDYRPPEWLVPELSLDFELGAEKTVVRATLEVARNGVHDAPLRLEGEGIAPVAVKADGADAPHRLEGGDLILEIEGDRATIEIVTELNPRANTKLMGLYESGGMLCTQCEAEGFRRITFFPDRPDVLTRYRVRMSADKALYPVLLSNGNPRPAATCRTAGIGRNGTIPSPSPAICSPSWRATSPPIATASSPARAARSRSASGCARRPAAHRATPWPR
jgi:aminopeptidase N